MKWIVVGLMLLPAIAMARGGPRGDDPQKSEWFARQTNMMHGSCCELGDGHELDPGDVRYDAATGLYSVLLPDPSESTIGKSLDDHYDKPKQWVEVVPLKMRDPAGGPPPISNPVIWYDIGTTDGVSYYKIYCFEPNAQF